MKNLGNPNPRNNLPAPWDRRPQRTPTGQGGAKKAERVIRIDRIVTHLITAQNPMKDIEERVGLKRDTLFREMKSPEFQVALRSAMDVKFSALVGSALDAVEMRMLDPETPAGVVLKIAQWLTERQEALMAHLGPADDGVDPVEEAIARAQGIYPPVEQPAAFISEDGVGPEPEPANDEGEPD